MPSRVTASIGIAALPEHGSAASTLLKATDKALCRAKSDGRNRAIVADAHPASAA